MAKTLLNLRTSLAYRLGEDSDPSDANEKSRRNSFINEAYRDVMRRHYWWFTETTDTFNSVANQASYTFGSGGVASDIRFILELRFQDVIYRQITQTDAMASYNIPYNNASQSYFIFNGAIYPVPPFTSSVTDGVSIKYYKYHTELSADANTILIPDIFSDCLVTYAYARMMQGEGERGSAQDAMEEYKEVLNTMNEEQNKYLFSLKDATGNEELTGAYK